MRSCQDPQVRLLQRMVELYSPTGQEAEVATFLIREMAKLGLETSTDEAGNVVGSHGTKGPTFLLCGHMDTVAGELPVKVENNRLYGRGAVDAKPSLAAMISAASTLAAEGFPAKLLVVGTVDEEGKGRGVKHLIERGMKVDYALFGEPSGVDSITIAYKGSLHLKIVCRTRSSHSSSPWLSRNSVEETFRLWNELQDIRFSEEKSESRFYSLTSAIKEIRGSSSGSTTPPLCELRVDFRLPPAVPPNRLFSEVQRTVDAFSSSNQGVEIDLKVEDSTEPYEADADSLLVRGFSWGIRDVLARSATLVRKTGTGDMNLIGHALKIPTITYGAGDSRLDHTKDEHIDLLDYKKSISVISIGLKRTLQLHQRVKKP